MAKVYERIEPRLARWIGEQPVFFVGTAPLSGDGLVNVSPKGLRGTFAVLDEHTFAYVDMTASGIETTAHLRENGRICVMFCSFDGTPNVVRLHGRGRVVTHGEEGFDEALAPFAMGLASRRTEARGVITVDVTRVADACGYAVPRMTLESDRELLDSWAERRSPEWLRNYRTEKNQQSLDGLPGLEGLPRLVRGALLVAGTTSDAGKSVLVAGICRWLHRRGVDVAPFKAQNMSNNSVVCADGGEIGRAQALQAAACGLAPSVGFNPVLLKPGSDRTSQVVVRGVVDGTVSAASYRERKAALLEVVTSSLASLREEHEVVICEGAGSPAEINLRATDIANMGLARAADLPVVVVGDIDRGGVLAHLFGTLAVLEPADQALIAGWIVNKFRGDPALLAPGLDQLRTLTGRPTLGVVPWSPDLWLDAEDSLGHVADGVVGRPAPPAGRDWLRVAVVRLPRVSNGTDVDALAAEPGVAVRYVTEPSRLADADLVVLPGSKATVSDLAWLRAQGLADAVVAHARAGRPVLGVCGGYQMLGRRIHDPHGVEAAPGTVEGLGLLDVEVTFDVAKHLGTPTGTALGEPVAFYEIHHGRELRSDAAPLVTLADGTPEGVDAGHVLGTHAHGLLENDALRRRLLARAAAAAGRHFVTAPDTSYAATRAAQLDLLGDLVETHLDTEALEALIEKGAPPGLPEVRVSSHS